MALPTFRSMAARRQQKKEQTAAGARAGSTLENASDQIPTSTHTPGVNIKLATRTRRNWIIISCFLFFISVIFLILTLIGNINTRPVIRSTYFFKLDLSDIIPASITDGFEFTNSLARSLGLHDFYQVGLWGFCEGYNNEGITYCSKPKSLYWFNPIEILLDELLSGATIALPANINTILDLIKIASNLMFGCFLTGVCMNFITMILAPVTLYSRWWSLPFAIWTFIAALLTSIASIIATVMFIIFKTVITSQKGLNIGASLGTGMLAFMWIGTICSILGGFIHLFMSCCCASRRDVRTGRKKGRASAYGDVGVSEKSSGKRKLPFFGKKKTASEAV